MLRFPLEKYRFYLIVAIQLGFCRIVIAQQQEQDLRFNTEGKFKIVQFTDIHWKHSSPDSRKKVPKLMANILDAEQPALVVLTGDTITSELLGAGLQAVIKPIVERKISWAAVLGNHDDEYNLNRMQIMATLSTMPGSLARSGPKDIGGCGNYVLEVKASCTIKNAAVLYFLDSRAYVPGTNKDKYDWIKFAQINWYRQTSRLYRLANNAKPLPSLMFFHIPLPEYEQAWNAKNTKCIGAKLESVCCPSINSGLFAAIVESKDVMGTFAGHDHNNDYTAYLHGICLAYGRVTGYDTYGLLPRGARVIELTEGKREFNSWIRNDIGKVVQYIHYPTSFGSGKR